MSKIGILLYLTISTYSPSFCQKKEMKDTNTILLTKSFDSLMKIVGNLKKSPNEIIVKTEADDNFIFQLLTTLASIIAIAATYLGVQRQIKASERALNDTQNREWCYQLIEIVSQIINEVEKNKAVISTTILSGKAVSDIQSISEIKIDLLLDHSVELEKKLFTTIRSYRKNKSINTDFDISNWLSEIGITTHNVINTRWQ